MLITRRSKLTGDIHTRDIPITREQLENWKSSGQLIQKAFPYLSPDDREFLLTGITPDEWDEAFKFDEN
jgi:hypothetical protein